MKNLFLALALVGFVGTASINTVSAITHSKVFVGGGDHDCKKDKKCKKGEGCCKTKTASKDEKKSCSSEGTKKCCSSSKATTAPADSVKVK